MAISMIKHTDRSRLCAMFPPVLSETQAQGSKHGHWKGQPDHSAGLRSAANIT